MEKQDGRLNIHPVLYRAIFWGEWALYAITKDICQTSCFTLSIQLIVLSLAVVDMTIFTIAKLLYSI